MTDVIQKLGDRIIEIDQQIADLHRERKQASDKHIKMIRDEYASARQKAMEKFNIEGVTDWGAA